MNNSSKKELSVKSTFIQKNIDMSGSFYYNNDENTTNQQSKENQILNEKIVKLYIDKRPLLSMKTIKKLANFNFTIQYTKNEYNSIVVNHIIHNDPGHIVAEFKDFLIEGDINEFLQKSYKINEINFLLPKIFEYYINSSVIFPNYVILPESKYIYKNIQKKQKVIDAIQDQEEKDERIKKGLIKEEEKENVFTMQILDSILNQTDTSGIKKYFGINTEGNSLEISKLNNIINDINSCDNKNLKFKNSSHINEYYTQSSKNETNNKNRTSGNNIRDKIFQKQNSRNTKCYIKKKQNDINSLKSKNKSKMSLEINKIIIDNGSSSNKNFKNIKNSYNLDKRGIQLSNSIKNINELTLNNKTNNGVLLRNIYSRNKDIPNKNFSKNKKEDDKNNKNKNKNKENFQKGRNFTNNNIKNNNYNNYYNTTNNINGGDDIAHQNHIINSNSNSNYNIFNKIVTKCITSRQFYKLENNHNNNELVKTLYKNVSLKNKRNSFKSNDNFIGKNKKIIKKSIINILLNNNKELQTEENSSIFRNRKSIKSSLNGCILESIAKSTFFSDKNNVKEKGTRRHMFSGLSQKDNNMKINQNKNKNKNKNSNKLFNSCSVNNMMNSYRTINKNYSSNNIISCINNTNNTSNLSNTFRKKDNSREFIHIYQKECKSQQKENQNEKNINNNKKVYTSNFNLNDKEKEIEKEREFSIKSYNDKNNLKEYFDKKNKIDTINNNNQYENCIFKNFKNDKINKDFKSLNNTKCLVHKKKTSTIINNNKDHSNQKIISEKKLAKELSENNIISESLNSPTNSIYAKKFYIKSDLREKHINLNMEKPLTLRQSINKNDINNTEKIELLTKKINEMKRCMKESSENNTNSISNIFRNKKVKRKNQTSSQNFKKQKDYIDSKRNRADNILLSDTINEVTIKNIYMNNNLINKVKKDYENKKLIRDNRQTMSNDDIMNSNKITRKTVKDFRSKSNYLLEEHNTKVNFNASKRNKYNNKELNTESNFNKKMNYDNENIPINVDKSNKNNKDDISLNNKMKSYSLKVIPIKQINRNKVNIKGIYINGFEKILKKKNNNNTRNNDIPLSVTERLKHINESSYLNSSNRYINTSNNNTKIFQKKKINDNSKRK